MANENSQMMLCRKPEPPKPRIWKCKAQAIVNRTLYSIWNDRNDKLHQRGDHCKSREDVLKIAMTMYDKYHGRIIAQDRFLLKYKKERIKTMGTQCIEKWIESINIAKKRFEEICMKGNKITKYFKQL